jgi:hypothetical protein
MNDNTAPDDAQALALQRFTLVSKVQDLVHQRLPRVHLTPPGVL